eukprot:CFRG1509T1
MIRQEHGLPVVKERHSFTFNSKSDCSLPVYSRDAIGLGVLNSRSMILRSSDSTAIGIDLVKHRVLMGGGSMEKIDDGERVCHNMRNIDEHYMIQSQVCVEGVSGVKRRRFPLWVLKVMVDTILLGLTLGLFGYLIYETPNIDEIFSNTDMIIRWAYWVISVVLSIIVIVSILVVYCRKEPEIASRNAWFIGQVIVCTHLSLICRLFGVLMLYQKLPLKFVHDHFWYYYVPVTQVGTWAFLMIVSAVTLRLRLIYKIWVCNDLVTTYQSGFMYHIPITVFSMVPALVGAYTNTQLSFAVQYIGAYIAWGFILGEMIFYLFKIWNITTLFTDVSSNVRICGLCFFVFIITAIYVMINGQNVAVILEFVIVTPCCFLIIWLELFSTSLVKVGGRMLGKSWLDDVDLAGLGYEFKNSTSSSLDEVMETPFLYHLFASVCEMNHSMENVLFIKAMIPYRRAIENGETLEAIACAEHIIVTFVTGFDCDMHINIGCKTKSVLREANLKNQSFVPESVDQELRRAEDRVTGMLQSSKAELLAMPEVQGHFDKLRASVQAGLLAREV